MLPDVMEFAAVYYRVLHAGGVAVSMNPLFKASEVAYYLSDPAPENPQAGDRPARIPERVSRP